MDTVSWSSLGVGLIEIPGDYEYLKKYSQHDKFQDGLQGTFQYRFHDKQTPTINYLKLIEFETYYIKPNPPLFFSPTKYAQVPRHGPFSLHTMLEGP